MDHFGEAPWQASLSPRRAGRSARAFFQAPFDGRWHLQLCRSRVACSSDVRRWVFTLVSVYVASSLPFPHCPFVDSPLDRIDEKSPSTTDSEAAEEPPDAMILVNVFCDLPCL